MIVSHGDISKTNSLDIDTSLVYMETSSDVMYEIGNLVGRSDKISAPTTVGRENVEEQSSIAEELNAIMDELSARVGQL